MAPRDGRERYASAIKANRSGLSDSEIEATTNRTNHMIEQYVDNGLLGDAVILEYM